MKTACFIPIKANSERVPGKNFRVLNGRKLYEYIIDQLHPEYDYYFQLFATAPYLQADSIKKCVNTLTDSGTYDSCFTALKNHGFYWVNNQPVNYRPGILPRSQDMQPVIEETTGLYGISRDSLERYRCRIGRNPYIYFVQKFEAVDINTEEDLVMAEYIGRTYWHYNG